ncbi:FAD-binding and (Fe-S)-binding domain-containing protein [uncultured Schumannella sp.]|uniref:FAD-binding and (Fe-S)-binding domain-containing protein n=1 Tax=uncultured Schumannella sp. TaxID=1195956 RepID=UPI0025FAE5CA|nr:FAD-binding and (Fe-S)-binding domain-containing protein [uncultured Schumannella sp.]
MLAELDEGGIRGSERSIDLLARAHDASHYLLVPSGVASPSSAADVAAVFAASARAGVPITFRSGGTSLSGQGVTGGILVDTRSSFREMTVLDAGARLRVQPGVTVRRANVGLARHGRKLGPDPASEVACTIGGVVANNSSGMACGTEQNTYRTLESLVAVLPSGTIIDTASPDADKLLHAQEPALYNGLLALRDRVRSNPHSVDTLRRQFSMKNTMGYGVNAFLDHDSPSQLLARLMIGSEGTLGFVAEATFRTVELPSLALTGLAIFSSLSAATAALPALVASGLATIELMDAASLRVAQQLEGAMDALRTLRVDGHAALLLEYQSSDADELAAQHEAASSVLGALEVVSPLVFTSDPNERGALWHIRKGLFTSVAGARPSGTTALLEDIVVPVAALLATCERLVELFELHGYEDSVIFGHAKDGNIHFMLNERFDEASSLERYQRFTEDMVDLVLSQGGSLKAEHGTGRIMAPFVRRQYGDELYEVMLEVKRLFDPQGLLNPGVVLSDSAASYLDNLKLVPTVESEVDRCVECGYCEPACPSKDITLTPRQRIVVRREMRNAELSGDTALLDELSRDYDYEGIDTCAVDGMCQVACPVSINTGDLVRRLRAENQGRLAKAGWKAAAVGWGAGTSVASVALSVADRMPGALVSLATSLGRRMLGADTVPQYSDDLPAGGVRRVAREEAAAEAVYFPSCTGTMFSGGSSKGGVGEAFLALCERAGVAVSIPTGIAAACCGTPWKSKGFADGHHIMAARTLKMLWEASRNGELPIVCDASSCTEGLERMAANAQTGPYSTLRFVDSVQFVHDRVMSALTVTEPMASIAIHPTCSSTQLGINDALIGIARAISDDAIVPEEWGCCGFAGDRGMLHPELTASATEREASEVGARPYAAYASTNRTCELGMSRATGSTYLHILELAESATR